MIELKIKFNNMKALSDFVTANPSVQTSKSSSVELPPVIENATVAEETTALTPGQKAAATKKRNKALKAAAEAEAALETPVSQVVETAATVMAAPIVEAAPVTAIDRDAYTTQAKAMIAKMQSLGIADNDIPVKLQEIFTNCGVPYSKIGDLVDGDLVTVVSALTNYVETLPQSFV